MTREELITNFSTNIERERDRLGYTQAQMAKALEMSLSSYKNMINGVSTNIPIYVAHLVYGLTGKLFFELCGDKMPELQVMADFRDLPKHKQDAIRTMVDIECQLAEYKPEDYVEDSTDLISVYEVTGNMQDGMIFDSINISSVPLGRYRKMLGNQVDCGLRVTTNHLHPPYQMGDILLVCQQPPRDGDTGIFINKESGRCYIRRYRQGHPCRLESITNYGHTITIDDTDKAEMNKWICFGYVITKMR